MEYAYGPSSIPGLWVLTNALLLSCMLSDLPISRIQLVKGQCHLSLSFDLAALQWVMEIPIIYVHSMNIQHPIQSQQ